MFTFLVFLYVSTAACLLYPVVLFFFSREKLKLCQQNIQSLLEQRDNLEREIEQQKVTDNR